VFQTGYLKVQNYIKKGDFARACVFFIIFVALMYELITILGPTASGKTAFAAPLAAALGSEVISADSRQIYRAMDIGTGKDKADYRVGSLTVPCHLIDICEPGERYSIFRYQRDFHRVFAELRSKEVLPILCGGSGLYIESVLRGYKLLDVPANLDLRNKLKNKSIEELTLILSSYKKLHNTTEIDSPQRAIRAIEIEEYYLGQTPDMRDFQLLNSLIVGIDIDRKLRREKITARLRQRLDEGMLDEIRSLLASGLSPDDLIYYGLEYKYLTLHVIGRLTFDEMFQQLEIAIHQFAKRQMTWFRGMERRGLTINWLNADMPTEEKIDFVKQKLNS
jgi:tRNA dimethylallyltransferase